MGTKSKYKMDFLTDHIFLFSLIIFLFILQAVFYHGLIRYIDIFTTVFIMGLFAMSFDLLMGYVGLFSFGHPLFFGTGAYVTTYFLMWTNIPYLVVLPLVFLVGCGLGLVISYLLRRAFHGISFSFTSLAINLMIYFLYRKRELRPFSGGEQGLTVPIPKILKSTLLSTFFLVIFLILISLLLVAVFARLRNHGNLSGKKICVFSLLVIFLSFISFGMWSYFIGLLSVADYKRITPNIYCLSLLILCICYLLAKKFAASPVGHIWRAIRESEVRTEVIGFNTFRYKSLALIISAGFAALAGGIYAPFHFAVTPDTVFSPMLAFYAIVWVIIGGVGTLNGPILGAAIVTFLERFLIDYIGGWAPVIVGIIFITFMFSLPHGIVGTWKMKGSRIRAMLHKLIRF